jgi:hypothetical protein
VALIVEETAAAVADVPVVADDVVVVRAVAVDVVATAAMVGPGAKGSSGTRFGRDGSRGLFCG